MGRRKDRRRLPQEDRRGPEVTKGLQVVKSSLARTNPCRSREWFAITAFPLIAGTFGPIASALNVCALVQPWRFELAPSGLEGEGVDVADPKWHVQPRITSRL